MAAEKMDVYSEVRRIMNDVESGKETEPGKIARVLTTLKEVFARVERLRKMSPEYSGVEVSPYVFRMLKSVEQRRRG